MTITKEFVQKATNWLLQISLIGLIGLLGWQADRLVSQIDNLTEVVNEMRITNAEIKKDQTGIMSDHYYLVNKVRSIIRRIQKLEDES